LVGADADPSFAAREALVRANFQAAGVALAEGPRGTHADGTGPSTGPRARTRTRLQLLCAPLQGLWSALSRQSLPATDTDTDADTDTDTDTASESEEEGEGTRLFDAIVADPPYDMKEAVRSAPTDSTDVATGGRGDAAEEAVLALLALAAAALRPQGRLVFFLPHRHARRPPPLGRIGPAVAAPAAAVPGSDVEEEQDGAMGMGMGVVGMPGKMVRRKSFRAAARRRRQGPSPFNGPLDPSAPAAGSLDDGGECPVHRLLRAGAAPSPASAPAVPGAAAATASAAGPLRVLSTHRQILSPTFSRWLCVLEKR
jgi:hypothetical protein